MDAPAPYSSYLPCSGSKAGDFRCPPDAPSMPSGRPQPAPDATIALRHGRETQCLPVHSILYAEVLSHELRVHTTDGKTLRGRGSLSALAQQLGSDCFLRCHKSFLVQLRYVTGLRRYCITLTGGISLPVSKQNYRAIQQTLEAYRF